MLILFMTIRSAQEVTDLLAWEMKVTLTDTTVSASVLKMYMRMEPVEQLMRAQYIQLAEPEQQ